MTTAHPVLPHCACEICVASIASRSERAAYKALADRFEGDLAKADGALSGLASFNLATEAEAFLKSNPTKPVRWEIKNPDTGEIVMTLTLAPPPTMGLPEVVASPDYGARIAAALVAKGVPGEQPKPEWVQVVTGQLATFRQAFDTMANPDPQDALRLLDKMADAIRQAVAAGKGGAPAPAPVADAAPAIAKAVAAVELVRGIQTKVSKADAETRRNHADLGRWSRETTVSDRLRSSDELRFTDLGEAVRHDHRREQLLGKAAKALKIDDVDHLRTGAELRLGKADAAAHDARREDLLTTFGRDNAL